MELSRVPLSDSIFSNMNAIMKNDVENVRVIVAEGPSEAYFEWIARKMTPPQSSPNPRVQKRSRPSSSVKPMATTPSEVEISSSESLCPEYLWNSTIARDANAQSPSSSPFSDVYLAGMSRRMNSRIMQLKFSTPQNSLQFAVSWAVGVNGSRVVADSIKNEELLASIRATINKSIQERISHDPDYNPDKFMNINLFVKT